MGKNVTLTPAAESGLCACRRLSIRQRCRRRHRPWSSDCSQCQSTL